MRLIRTSLTVLSLSYLLIASAHAAVNGSNEVSCSIYGSDAVSCNQCFDGGTDYVGDTTAKAFDDTFINSSATDDVIIRRSGGLSAGPVSLQSAVTVGLSADYGVTFPSNIVWFDYGGDVAVLFFGTSTQIAHMNGGVLFTAVSAGANPNKPALRYEYIASFQKYDFGTSQASGPVMNHKECAFVSPRFCGDALVTNGEVCDDGSQNGQPGKCNLSCTTTIPNPTCDSMTATPISGSAPLDVSVVCNATNATAYHIDCGNGTTNLASTAVCKYVTGGTFSPRCTVDGSITSPACTKTVTVAPPPATPICSSTITGTQTFPITSVTPGLCNVGVVDLASFRVTIVGGQTNYVWNCTNGVTSSPVCSANYTPAVATSPDLALKKYVNGFDAQTVATAVDIPNNSAYNYTIETRNAGSGNLVSSTTTIIDPLPAGVTLTATPIGAGWLCTGVSGSTSFTCTRTEALAIGASFPTIAVAVRVSSSSTFLTNTAELSNPNDVMTANNTDPAVIHIIPVSTPGPYLSIKKYAKDITTVGDSETTPVSIARGERFNYYYQVQNTGSVAAAGVVVEDIFPRYLTFSGAITVRDPVGADVTSDWTCVQGSRVYSPETVSRINLLCTKQTPFPANSGIYTFSVPVVLAVDAPLNNSMRNVAYVCLPGEVCSHEPPPDVCTPTNNPKNDPACIIVTPARFDLSIKKFVNGADAQTVGTAVNIPTSTGFTYVLQVRNEGPLTATGTTTITDTLPAGVTLLSVPNVAPWICTTNLPANSFACTTSATIASGVTLSGITVNATTTSSTGTFTNIGIVANPGDTNPVNNTDPAVITVGPPIIPIPGFDLSLKKYIGTNDAQTVALGVSTTTNAVLSYVIRVTNSGASSFASSGTTTVQDILPSGVEYDTAAIGSGWTCSVTLRALRCTSVQTIAPGASYPDITVPFRVTIGAGQNVVNIAAVDNPNEFIRCTATGTLPTTDTGVCTLDTSNSDPAVLFIPGGGGGGTSNVGKKCVNGVASCATYNSLAACIADGIPATLCYASDAVGMNMCATQVLSCSGPGGGCTNPFGCGTYTGGRCGDGVLGSSPDEECDVVGGAPWCSASCKIIMTTNPGANPITDLWMTIPYLAGTHRIGYNWLDGMQGKVAFADNRMVLGAGTKAFTLNDTVGFGIKMQYRIPLIIEASKKICLKSEGTSMNSESICTTFGEAANISPLIGRWQRADGTWFVNIGAGDYQKINPVPRPPVPAPLPTIHTAAQQAEYDTRLQAYYDWRQYTPEYSNSANNITLFKGSTQYARLGQVNLGPTLNSAFFGRAIGTDGTIGLVTDTGVDLVKLSVRVSGAVVSSIGSSANRSLQAFLNPGNLFAGFLTATSGDTSTTSSNTTGTTTIKLPVIIGGAAGTVSTITDIERYAVNGNKNVLAVNGDLTIDCPVGRSIFEMSGVRTVIVTGKLIIKCNIVYASNDAVSSWAWITKGGNIEVYNGIGPLSNGAITNLAGVFVSIKEGSTGGDITYTGNNTTQTILRIEGSIYGNAAPLFNSRLYARATGSYDILTTGTILTYSNRALVSPPPLLSQYLGNYQVERVIQ